MYFCLLIFNIEGRRKWATKKTASSSKAMERYLFINHHNLGKVQEIGIYFNKVKGDSVQYGWIQTFLNALLPNLLQCKFS